MRQAHFDRSELRKILGRNSINKGIIEKNFLIKMNYDKSGNVSIESVGRDAISEYVVLHALDALTFGFNIDDVLLLRKENCVYKIVNLKDFCHGSRLKTVKGRIIGSKGQTKNTLSQLSGCELKLKENRLGIIGNSENVDYVCKAIQNLIRGSKHGSVYGFLEKNQRKLKELDKEEIEKTIKF